VPNISTVRSIRYENNNMTVFKASGIGSGVSVPYKRLAYETNMRVISPFGHAIQNQESAPIPKP
jgi:hypothetical protein